MSPEFGATSTLFPIDDETLAYLRLTGRTAERIALVERYAKEQGLWREPGPGPDFDEMLELDLATVDPSVAGPRRPQDRVPLDRRCATTSGPTSRTGSSPLDEAGVEGRPPDGGEVEESSAESFPASDPPSFAAGGRPRPDAPPAEPARRRRPSTTTTTTGRSTHRGRRPAGDDPDRLGRDRRDHLVHEHLEPDGDGRRRAARPERRRPRPDASPPTVKTSLAPGLEGRHRLPRGGRADGAARAARVRPRRLRLHDLHRQLRPARRADREGDRGERPRRRGRPLGQPQLRGPDPSPRPGQLPRLAAARRRVRPRRPGRHRPDDRAARHRIATDARSCSPTSGPRPRRSGRSSAARSTRSCSAPTYAVVFDGDDRWRALPIPAGDRYDWNPRSTYIAKPPFFDGLAARAGSGPRHRRRPGARRPRRLGHDRPHLAGRLDRALVARRRLAPGAQRRRRSSSTRTAPGAGTTR